MELYLSVINKIIELLKIRDARFKTRFDLIHRPIHEMWQEVHEDYVGSFRQVLEVLAGRESFNHGVSRFLKPSFLRLRQTRNVLKRRREEFAPVREKLRECSSTTVLDGMRAEEKEFLANVVSYFPGMDAAGHIGFSSPLSTDGEGVTRFDQNARGAMTPYTFILRESEFMMHLVNAPLYLLVADIERIVSDLDSAKSRVEESYAEVIYLATRS